MKTLTLSGYHGTLILIPRPDVLCAGGRFGTSLWCLPLGSGAGPQVFIGTPAAWGWGFAGTVVPARLPPLFLTAGFSPDSTPPLHADLALEGTKPLGVREGALSPTVGTFDNVQQRVQLSHLREWGAAGIW